MRLKTSVKSNLSAFFRLLAVLFIGFGWVGFNAQARESNFTSHDPYEILGVETNATKAQIRDAWSRLVQLNHPDAVGAENPYIRVINDAYQLLKDDARRLAYDTGEADFNGYVRENDFQISDREKAERERESWHQFFRATEPKVRKILSDLDQVQNNDSEHSLHSDALIVLYGVLSMPMTGANGEPHAQPHLLTPGHRKAYGQMLEDLGLMNVLPTRDKRLICDRDPIEAIDAILRQDFIDELEVKEVESLLKAFRIFYADQPHAHEDFINVVKNIRDHGFLKSHGIDNRLRRALMPVLQYYVDRIKASGGCKTERCKADLANTKALLALTQTWSDKAASCLRALLP